MGRMLSTILFLLFAFELLRCGKKHDKRSIDEVEAGIRDAQTYDARTGNAESGNAGTGKAGSSDSGTIDIQAYIKSTNTEAGERYGYAVSLSSDGSTLVVGVVYDNSAATGVNGNKSDKGAENSGAVYVYTRSGSIWSQQAYIKASNTGAKDWFGTTVSLSSDGNTLAVGAPREDSVATGVNGNQSDNSAEDSGAVYVYTRSGSIWSQQAYIKASNTEIRRNSADGSDQFGDIVSLSSDGSTLAVGMANEDSAATGVNGNQSDNSARISGAVYVYTRSGSTWSQQAYIKASNTKTEGLFGYAVSLSSEGDTLAVGAIGEDSAATGVNGDQSDNSAGSSGAVYVYTRSGSTWSQQAYIKASNTGINDRFGDIVSLSSDGSTLAVRAQGERSAATGVNGDQSDNSAEDSGAVYVYIRSDGTWSQQAYIKASNTRANDWFGSAVSLSSDGSTLVVGAYGEDSAATGVNGDQSDDSAKNSGAVYVYTRSGSTWSQQAYIKASNTETDDLFGYSASLSSDGSTLAVGAHGEDSAATGVNGDQSDNSAKNSGAVYVF